MSIGRWAQRALKYLRAAVDRLARPPMAAERSAAVHAAALGSIVSDRLRAQVDLVRAEAADLRRERDEARAHAEKAERELDRLDLPTVQVTAHGIGQESAMAMVASWLGCRPEQVEQTVTLLRRANVELAQERDEARQRIKEMQPYVKAHGVLAGRIKRALRLLDDHGQCKLVTCIICGARRQIQGGFDTEAGS